MEAARSADVPENAPSHCPGTSSEQAGKSAACQGCPNQSVCATAPKGPDPDLALIAERMKAVKHKILVLSGKGGVGKSTFSAQLAFALASQGKEVGLLDIDICGPSMPKMLGLEGQEVHQSNLGWSPVYVEDNLAVMSIGFMLPNPDEAVIWRGPRKNGLIKQFLKDVHWGELDYLVVDAPPGTSDEHITIAQCIQAQGPADGAVIVTTPQEVAIIDVRKEINFCRKTNLPVLGVVENMSGLQQRVPGLRFTYPAATSQGEGAADADAGAAQADVTEKVLAALASAGFDLQQLVAHAEVFPPSGGGAAKMCKDMGVRLLGQVPLDPALTRAAEAGRSIFEPLAQEEAAQKQGAGAAAAGEAAARPTCLPALKAIVASLLLDLEGPAAAAAAPAANGSG